MTHSPPYLLTHLALLYHRFLHTTDEHFAKEGLRLAQLTNKCTNGDEGCSYSALHCIPMETTFTPFIHSTLHPQGLSSTSSNPPHIGLTLTWCPIFSVFLPSSRSRILYRGIRGYLRCHEWFTIRGTECQTYFIPYLQTGNSSMLPYSLLFPSSSVRCLCSDQMNIDQIIFHQHNTTPTNLSSTPSPIFPPTDCQLQKTRQYQRRRCFFRWTRCYGLWWGSRTRARWLWSITSKSFCL